MHGYPSSFCRTLAKYEGRRMHGARMSNVQRRVMEETKHGMEMKEYLLKICFRLSVFC